MSRPARFAAARCKKILPVVSCAVLPVRSTYSIATKEIIMTERVTGHATALVGYALAQRRAS